MSGEPEVVATRRQKASSRRLASPGPPVASPWASMAAFIAPALAPLTAPIRMVGSSSRRSSTPQEKAPREPPPCKASVTGRAFTRTAGLSDLASAGRRRVWRADISLAPDECRGGGRGPRGAPPRGGQDGGTDHGQDQRGREPRQRARRQKEGDGGKGQEGGRDGAGDPGGRPPGEGEVHVAIPRCYCAVQQIWSLRHGMHTETQDG